MRQETLITYAGFFVLLMALAVPLGSYMARVYQGQAAWAGRLFGPLERWIYRMAGVKPDQGMPWREYATALLLFNGAGLILLLALQLLQGWLPLNPGDLGAVSPGIALNTAVSFVTNTNWQSYSGETTMSHLTQMLGLTVQNFLSAATGMAVAVALARGFRQAGQGHIGNFWEDLTRGTLYVLLPLSVILAIVLVALGVVQSLAIGVQVQPLDALAAGSDWIPLGPVASQEAIKQLGTNGGGFFNVNSAHPFENPSAWTNFLENLAILLLPAALPLTMGRLMASRRHGWVLVAAMFVLLLPPLMWTAHWEQQANPALSAMQVDHQAGNMEGKEMRLGADASSLWAASTTAASNGSVNAMHDSFTPMGSLGPLWLMQLGEVSFGGVGSGVYGLLVFAILAVFIGGLMVGRTPEFLGKKMGAFEMKMACLAVILPSAAVLVGTALACLDSAAGAATSNPGPHGFTQILYAFTSAANNNGSAFAGLDATSSFYTLGLSAAMLVGRFGVILPVLAMAGSLAAKGRVPRTTGTLPTDTPLFVGLLVGTVVLVGALTFLPALALGPIVEHLKNVLAGGAM